MAHHIRYNTKKWLPLIAVLISIVGLYISYRHNYLLFHSLVELFSIIVSFTLFLLVWNSRHIIQNNFFLFIGITYLFVGCFDLLHTLSYSGMGIFPNRGGNLPTQLWISARYLQTSGFLIALLVLKKKFNENWVMTILGLISIFLLFCIFDWKIFPACYIEGKGLTRFKIYSEYLISGLFVTSAIFLYKRRRLFLSSAVFGYLMAAFGLTIASELAFTEYISPYDNANLLGHIFKTAAVYLIYRALVEEGLRRPYETLFADLEQAKNQLQQAHDELEIRVQKRTEELARSEERFRLITETIQDVFWMCTPGITRILYVSPAYGLIWGRNPEKLRESPQSFIDYVHSDDRPAVWAALEGHLHGKWELEYRIVRPNNEIRWIRDRGYPIYNQEGGIRYMTRISSDITEYKQAMEQILVNQKELHRLTAELEITEERERRKIAIDLHDSILQILAFSTRELEGIQPYLHTDHLARVEEVRRHLEQSITQMRTLIFNLSPSILYELGLEAALEDLLHEFFARQSIKYRFSGPEDSIDLPEYTRILLYRAVRELLVNITKHAEASKVNISLGKNSHFIQIVVEDDGKGMDLSEITKTNQRRGFGLVSMTKRLENIGGGFALKSGPQKGTKITLTAPLTDGHFSERTRP